MIVLGVALVLDIPVNEEAPMTKEDLLELLDCSYIYVTLHNCDYGNKLTDIKIKSRR